MRPLHVMAATSPFTRKADDHLDEQQLRAEFHDESERLFDAAYRQLRTWNRHGAIDDPDLNDAIDWIEQIM